MIILNVDLGEKLEIEFYKKVKMKNISYLDYVEQLIIDDLTSEDNASEDNDFSINKKQNIKDGDHL